MTAIPYRPLGDARGPIVHAAVAAGARVIADDLQPLDSWTIEATVPGLGVGDGVIATVSEPDLDCVRALLVRRGRLGVLGWHWRGGQAFWGEVAQTPAGETPTHVAATLGVVGDLVLYVDGRLVRTFAVRGLFPGRHSRQRLLTGAAVRFAGEEIPGWRGQLRDVALHDRPLAPAEVEQHARAAVGGPEPVVAPPPSPRAPDPVGCENPAHLPAWRPQGDRLRCLQCEPPRGCSHDDHEPYWRPSGSDMRVRSDDWWQLTCTFCETAARRSGTTDSGEPS